LCGILASGAQVLGVLSAVIVHHCFTITNGASLLIPHCAALKLKRIKIKIKQKQ